MTTYLQDDFNRANSTTSLGTPSVTGTYTVVAGTWGIISNQGYNPTSASPAVVTVPAAVDVDLQVTMAAALGSGSGGIFVRYLDASNYISMVESNTGLFIIHRVAGTSSANLPIGGSTVAGDVFRIIAKGPSVYFYVNNILKTVMLDVLYGNGASLVGYINNNTSVTRLDNALAQDAPTDPTLGFPTTAFAYLGRDTKTLDTGAG